MELQGLAKRGAPVQSLSIASHPTFQRAASIVALIALWQAASAVGLNSYFVSSPSEVVLKLWAWIASGEIWPHLFATVTNMMIGFVFAAIAAVGLSLLFSSNRLVEKVFSPLLFVAFSTPKIVMAPILMLWVGIGQPSVVILAFIAAFFTIFFNINAGVRSVPDAYLNTAAILGASPLTTALKFRLPAAAPFILAGLHQGLIYAFHGAILGEMTASDTGIGYLIIYGATSQDSTQVIAGLTVIGAVSYFLLRLINLAAERGVAPATDAGPVA
jgi:NitT/TauT family transport system permease protein